MNSPIIDPDMPPEVYHADPCADLPPDQNPAPSLSASIAKVIHASSPKHAEHYHPRLGGNGEAKEQTKAMRSGSILHWLVTGCDKPPMVILGEYQSAIKRRADKERLMLMENLRRTAGEPPDDALVDQLNHMHVYVPVTLDEQPDTDWDAYRTDAAKTFKLEALERGWVPMKRAEYDDAIAKAEPMANAINELGVDY